MTTTDTEIPRLHIVLVQPEIAPNTGAIGRTCVGLGAMLWLVRPLGFRIDDHKIRRAGLDYWEHLRWKAVDDLAEVEAPGQRWFFSTKARRSYLEANYHQGDALVFGPESRGLPVSWLRDYEDFAVRIPIRPEARSLNLGSSVAVAAFEAIRQIGEPGS